MTSCVDHLVRSTKLLQRSNTLKLILRSAAIVCAAAAMVAPAFSQTTGSQTTGADTFKARCITCHGADGQSNTPVGTALKAVSLKDPVVVSASDADLITVVKNGKKSMPAFGTKLSDDQIKAVVAYIRTLQK
jgi:mono/diheme cytochrome c family protein